MVFVVQPLTVGVFVDVKLEVKKPDETGIQVAIDGNKMSVEEGGDVRVMAAVVGQTETEISPV